MLMLHELIGDLKKYQMWICFLLFLSKFGVGTNHLAIIFLAPPAVYQCPDANETCCENPIYNKTVYQKTIVMEWDLICGKSWMKDFNQTAFQLGVLFGSLIFGMASDRYGRRPVMILAVIGEVFTGLATCFLPDYWSFTVFRTVLGFAVGGVMVVGFVIVMEYIGNTYREIISALFHVPFTIGYIILAPLGYFIRNYVYFQLTISLFNVILLSYICFLPESPRWLLAMHKTEKAVALIERIAKVNKLPTEDIETKVELYQLKHKSVMGTGTVLDLFRTPNIRKNIIVMSITWLVSSYCFFGVSHYISHLTGDVFINVVASGSVSVLACFIAIPIMKFMNRKTVVVVFSVAASLCLFTISFVPQGQASIVLGCIGVLFSFVVFIVVYLYCTEMFPTVVRNAALGICSMMARLGAMIAPFVAALRPFGKWCAPVGFGIPPLLCAALCLMLPETKDCELLMTIDEGEAFGKKTPRSTENTNEQIL